MWLARDREKESERDAGKNNAISILYLITDSDFGGTEASVSRLACGMKQRGMQVIVCSMKRPGFMAQELERRGIGVTHLNLPQRITFRYPLQFTIGFLRFRRLLRRTAPDIVHSFLFQANLMAGISRFLALGKRARIIASVRCIDRNKAQWRILLDRWALKRADMVMAVSKAVKKRYCDREGIASDAIRVVYHGVEERLLEEGRAGASIRARLDIKQGEWLIGTAARLHRDKGLGMLLQGFARIGASIPRVRLLIVGDGPEREALRGMAERLGIAERVIFAGFQPDVLPWMASLDIFCLTSEEEGLPQSLLEAMALGRPVVATRVGGTGEVIGREGKEGILIPPGDADALCRAVVSLIRSPRDAQRMGNEARERIRREFLIEDTLEKMAGLYEECIAQERP
ncbi:MAG: glycosyltransferase [bacterium]